MPKGIYKRIKPVSIGNKNPNFGKIASKETREKMRIGHLGRKYKPMSLEGRLNISKAQKGRISPRKGAKLSEEQKNKISQFKKGKKYPNRKSPPPFSEERRKEISERMKGKRYALGSKRTEKDRKVWSEVQKKRVAEGRHNNYKGGITPENHRIRESVEYKLWRDSNFARDGYTCRRCNVKGGKLRVHHIRNFAEVLELRTSIENGITLCKDCHMEFHHLFGNKGNNREQIDKFIKDCLDSRGNNL